MSTSSAQEQKLKDIASDPAKDIKIGKELSDLFSRIVELSVDAALGAGMERHRGYSFNS